MDIRDWVAIIVRRKWIILVALIVTTAAAGWASALMTPVYSATATIRVATGVLGRVEYADYVYSERLMNTYAEIIMTQPVLEQVQERLHISTLPQIEVEVVPDTELLRITAQGSHPGHVRDYANALADVLQTQSQSIYAGAGKSAREALAGLLAQVENELAQARSEQETLTAASPKNLESIEALSRTIELRQQTLNVLLAQYEDAWLAEAMRATNISVIEPATTPMAPSKPRTKVNILLGAAVGLAAGVGLALVFENLDTTFHAPEEVQRASQISILGLIPEEKGLKKAQSYLTFSANGFTVQHEAYRRLRTNILALSSAHPLKTLMATSADRAEGKSTIVANLAVAFAEADRRVVVLDADLRLPSQHKLFSLRNDVGLSSALSQDAALSELVQESEVPDLYLLASGPLRRHPAELLGSPQMKEVIKRLSQEFDVVLIDTPGLISVTDAAVLGPLVDGVVLVVSQGQTQRETMDAALRQLADVKANVIGLVVNRTDKSSKYYGRGTYSPKKRVE